VVDTNVIVALIDAKDVHHSISRLLIESIEEKGMDIVVFDCVINEVFSVIAKRSRQRGYSFKDSAVKINEILSSLKIVRIYQSVKKYHDRIIELMIKTEGNLNYHDALICLVMKEKKILEIASLDRGFENVPWVKVLNTVGTDSKMGVTSQKLIRKSKVKN